MKITKIRNPRSGKYIFIIDNQIIVREDEIEDLSSINPGQELQYHVWSTAPERDLLLGTFRYRHDAEVFMKKYPNNNLEVLEVNND